MNQKNPLLLLAIDLYKVDFIIYVNDVPMFFYMQKKAESEQFVILNSYLQAGVNLIEIKAISHLVPIKSLAEANFKIGKSVDGRFENKPLDKRNYLEADNGRLQIIRFNAPPSFTKLPWHASPVLSPNHITAINQYYLSLHKMYTELDVTSLVKEFDLAIAFKRIALPNRDPNSFRDLLIFGLEAEKEDDTRQVLPINMDNAYQIVANGRIAYTLNNDWKPTIGSIDHTQPQYYVGSLSLYLAIVNGQATIVGYE